MAFGCQENSSPIDRKKSNKKYPSKKLEEKGTGPFIPPPAVVRTTEMDSLRPAA
jgi:hypothetical protein